MSNNEFHTYRNLGYTLLVPVLQPGCSISPRSSYHAVLTKGKDPRGKGVGVKGQNGDWYGLDWIPHESTEEDLERWGAMGAGVGKKTGLQPDGTSLVAIDADTTDAVQAAQIKAVVERRFGQLAVRIGQAPKAAYLIRTAEPFKYTRVDFEQGDGKLARVELLSDGKHIVVHGIHPKTMQPYTWPNGVPRFADIKIVEPAELIAMLEEIRSIMPAAKPLVSEGGEAVVDQESLRGDPVLVRKALRAIPNTTKDYSTRESYRDIGYATKAALPDHPDEALEMFQEWCASWVDPPGGEGNDPEVVASDWRRMKGPYRRGAQYLYRLADAVPGTTFNSVAERFFKPLVESKPELFQTDDTPPKLPRLITLSSLRSVDRSTLPPREWLIEPRSPRGAVTQCVGEPAISKSTFMIRDALICATGREDILRGSEALSPERLHRRGPALIYNNEDSMEEMKRRLGAAMDHYGLREADMVHPVHLWSGIEESLFIMERGAERGPLVRAIGYEQLREAIILTKAVFVALDPQASLGRGAIENDTNDMNDLLQCLATLAAELGVCITVVHHTAKATRGNAGDMGAGRGAFSAVAKVRAMYTLCAVDEDDRAAWGYPPGEYIRLDYGKSSYGAKARVPLVFRRLSVAVGNGAGYATERVARDPDELPAGAALAARGDTAPVIEFVGLGIKSEAKAAADETRVEQRNHAVASAVFALLNGRVSMSLGTEWPLIGKQLIKQGLIQGASREDVSRATVLNIVKFALCGPGVIVERNGRSFHVLARKQGSNKTAPWVLSATTAPNLQALLPLVEKHDEQAKNQAMSTA